MKLKTKVSIHSSSITELFQTVKRSIMQLNESMNSDVKEISVYRLTAMMAVYKKLFARLQNQQIGKVITITFSLAEILAIRYCLLHRRTTPDMSQLFIEIDSKLHPNLFVRKEASNV